MSNYPPVNPDEDGPLFPEDELEEPTALEKFDARAENLAKFQPPPEIPAPSDPYFGVASAPFPDRVAAVLNAYQVVPDDWIDIKPNNGQLYLPHMKARAIFNEAFGFGGWGMVPCGEPQIERKESKRGEHVILYREFRFYALGRFVRQAMGAGDYYTSNADANLSDAAEMCESFALNRMAKFLGIAGQCWDKAYAENWKRLYAVETEKGWKKRGGAEGQNPPPQPRKEPSEPVMRSEGQSPQTVGVQGDVIMPVKLTEGEKNGKSWAFAKDADGLDWSISRFEDYATVENAIRDKSPVKVEFKVNGKYRNVSKVSILAGDEL